MLNFPGVMFRNVVCHGNFYKYDNVDAKWQSAPWREALMCMHNHS